MIQLNKNESLTEKVENTIRKVAQHAIEATSVVFYTGAGISTPSGIPDFRSPGGLWDKYDPYEVSSLRAFRKKPEKVWEFFRDLYEKFVDPEPNPAHDAITDIQKLLGEDKVHIATQNIDGLHQKSGSVNVYELHGTPYIMHCIKCSFEEGFEYEKHMEQLPYPVCPKCKKPLKPKAVLFEEALDLNLLRSAMRKARTSEIAIGAGSSLTVFPASDVLLAPPPKTKKALFNLSPTMYDRLIHYLVKGDVVETLPSLYTKIVELK